MSTRFLPPASFLLSLPRYLHLEPNMKAPDALTIHVSRCLSDSAFHVDSDSIMHTTIAIVAT